MKLEMICTGEEVLAGQIVDTNAAWLGNRLIDAGFEMQRRTTVGDRLSDLVCVFEERSQYADIILVNGGLGPTADDLSAQAMAQAMSVELVENEQWLAILTHWFRSRNLELSASNKKQAMIPKGATIIDNPVGTACGFRVQFNRAWLFFTPGVPHEFKQMVDQQFIPFISSQSDQTCKVTVSKLLTLGMGESPMAELLESLSWPQGITLGYRSYMPYLELKLIGRDISESMQQQAVEQAKHILADTLVAQNKDTLAEEVHHLLHNSGQSLAIAESLTGGEISSQLVAFAGSSRYFRHAIVSYCNAAKMHILKVQKETLDAQSEVSLACVAEMAIGTAQLIGEGSQLQYADYAIATSGMAGPSGGSAKIPIGTVVLAIKAKDKVYCQKIAISANRSRAYIRELAVAVALDMLRRAILLQSPIAQYGYIKSVEQKVFDLSEFN